MRPLPLALALGLAACGAPAPAAPGSAPPPRSAATAPGEEHAPLLPEGAARVGFDRLARFPEPGWHVPRKLAFSPDGRLLTFLASEARSAEMALWAAEVEGGPPRVLVRAADLPRPEGKLSEAEELRRERQRSRIEGITDYRWASAADVLVIPAGGDVVVRTAEGLRRLTATPAPEIDPQPCPTGRRVAWVREGDLFAHEPSTGREVRLTHGGPEGTTRGLTDFLAQEELDEPSGFSWAPDCETIAYLAVDERGVDEIPLVGYRAGEPTTHVHQRYPRAGRPNPRVELRLVDLRGRDRGVALPPEVGPEPYLVRLTWADDARTLWLQALPRHQRERHLVAVDVASATARRVVSVSSRAWVDPSPLVIARGARRGYWLEPDPSGAVDRVVALDLERGARAVVSPPDLQVFDLHGLDAGGATLFATVDGAGAIGRRLVALDAQGAAPPRVLTPEPGTHAVVVGAKGTAIADVHSAHDRLPAAVLRGPDGRVRSTLPVARDEDLDALSIRPPALVSFAHAGTTLWGAVLRPRDHDPDRRYPLVLMVYGGPGAQLVADRWSPRLLWQHLADRGFFVAQVDNRGAAGRGPAFEHALVEAGALGEVELADQLAFVEHLLAMEPTIDPARVGVHGHSYGGYLAIAAVLRHPEVFRAAAAGSPVTDWALYDSAYTERYLGRPGERPGAYERSSLLPLAGRLAGDLLLLGGMLDENVHFEHTARLADALGAAGKSFELAVFPGERHGYRGPGARAHANRRVVDFLVRSLGP